jgi:SAM-dependent MidA family methyltransferase
VNSLGDNLRELIALEGPITVERYMDVCLKHYYATRDPLGPAGDFTTSPEISQIFGELLGLWVLEIWQAIGRPASVNLVELGPGRGTLMADMLRAANVLPDFLTAATVHLVETSPVLREKQQANLAASGAAITWHDSFTAVPEGPLLLVANEFFDALPVRQFVATERGWCERLVGIEDDALIFGLNAEPERSLGRPPQVGAIREAHVASTVLIRDIATRLAQHRGAALIVDYGYWGPAFGDTLQALKGHTYVDPLDEPGEADLTTHVDFAQLAHTGLAAGASIHGIETQANFLHALGIATRATRLKQRATPKQAIAIDQAVGRLTATEGRGMGELFKVLALTDSGLENVPGLHARLEAPQR